MAKYDSHLAEVKLQLASAQNILIALPNQLSVDKLAAGLSLMLSLKKSAKQVAILTAGIPLVAHSNLYGIGEVKNSLNANADGNYILTLGNVVDSNGQVPALAKLDWHPEGNNLNLVFHVNPGYKFEPSFVTPKSFVSTSFQLIFVLGANSLNDLASVYTQNASVFSQAKVVNIDNSADNTNFGNSNIVDQTASSISELVNQIIFELSLPTDNDIASNIVAGIYDATANLTSNVQAETFAALGQALQLGAKLPTQSQNTAATPTPTLAAEPQASLAAPTSTPGFDIAAFFQNSAPQASPITPSSPSAPTQVEPGQSQESQPSNPFENFVSPPVVNGEDQVAVGQENTPSAEERPTGEFATSSSPETVGSPAPDWLTPKIFKGGSVG